MGTLFLVVAAGLGASFLCSILEAVLLSMTHSYVALLQERGERAGTTLARMRANIDEPIAAILTLNTIAHTVSATVAGALALRVFGEAWIAAFSAALTLAILVFSEILPKTIGATYWKQLGIPAAWVLRVLILILKPILIPLAWFNRLISPRGTDSPTVSRAELEILAGIGRREGTIDEEEWRVVRNVMNLDQIRVSRVMTPRTRIAAVPVAGGVTAARATFREYGHRRYPVYESSIDEIIGVITVSDILRAEDEGLADLRPFVRPVRFVPETKPVEHLIRELRSERLSMAIVIDEFGGTAGLATMEDLFEEIVGDIRDEHDPDYASIRRHSDGSWIIAGMASIDDLNQRLELDLSAAEHVSLAGFLIAALERVGQVGDVVVANGGRFEILAMDGPRIERVRFSATAESDPSGRVTS